MIGDGGEARLAGQSGEIAGEMVVASPPPGLRRLNGPIVGAMTLRRSSTPSARFVASWMWNYEGRRSRTCPASASESLTGAPAADWNLCLARV